MEINAILEKPFIRTIFTIILLDFQNSGNNNAGTSKNYYTPTV